MLKNTPYLLKTMVWLLVILGVIALALYLYFKFFKLLRLKNVIFVDGSLGTGKSFFSVSYAVRLWKKQVRKYRFKKLLLSVFRFGRFKDKYKTLEKPVLYSNIKLRNVPFVVVNKELLFRENFRFAYNSVVLLDEFSLIADQMCFKDSEINERLSEFFKLFRHETRGGYLVINSQSTSDLHFSLKYVLSDYLYIHSKIRLPFLSLLKVQEVSYSADKNGTPIVSTADTGDITDNLKILLILNKYFKYYDTYCYSIFTDSLPVYAPIRELSKDDSLKADDLVSFKQYKFLYENLKKEKGEKKQDEQGKI